MPEQPAQHSKTIAVDLIHDDGDWSCLADAEALASTAAAAVAHHIPETPDGALVSIALSCDEVVAGLNGSFRNMPKPTNVLSFPAGQGGPRGFLGDVILAEETIAREAAEQDTRFDHHVQHLIVHGLLHLLGYDHETPAEAGRMEALEITILADLGISNPYTGELETAKRE